MDNDTRASIAEDALLQTFSPEHIKQEGLETSISDLMCNLLHLWNQDPKKTLTLKQLFFRIENNFKAEIS